MALLSVRQALAGWGLDLHAGVRGLHPFFAAGAVLPFDSIRALVVSLEWPQAIVTAQQDYPFDREPGWSDELNGVTHDADSWFVAQKHRLLKFPVGHDLNAAGLAPGAPSAGIPVPGYDHFGDPDCHAGVVYVPLEGGQPPMVAAFAADTLRFLGAGALTAQTQAPWCAVHPSNGLLYTSDFNGARAVDPQPATPLVLQVYARTFGADGASFTLTHVGNFPLVGADGAGIVVNRVQGGTFSPNGHLYLVSDTAGGGILGFDVLTGRLVTHHAVNYQPIMQVDPTGGVAAGVVNGVAGLFGADDPVPERVMKEELQGITAWDLDDGRAPGIRGQLHLLMIDNVGSGADDLYFKHFTASDPQDTWAV